jgi:TolA-binding protein
MPIPKPKISEIKEDFITRFMSDKKMIEEYPEEKQRTAIANQQWKDRVKEMAENVETVNMQKEILSVGKWNGIDITEKTIDDMISNFKELKERKPIPLRVGHASDDKPNTKIMAAGWVDSLEKIGNKLVANIRNTPLRIAEFIQKEFLKPVSIEFRRFWKDGETGKEYKNVLSAIALMGVSAPAVAGLKDFDISFSDEDADVIKIEYQEENNMAGVKELQDEINSLKAKLEASKKDAEKNVEFQDELKKKDEELKKKELELKKFKEKQDNSKIEEFIEKNSSEKSMKILPVEKERVKRILKALDNEVICFEEKDVKMNVREEFQAFIEGLEKRVEFNAKTEKGKIEKKIEFANKKERDVFLADKIDDKIKEFSENGKTISYDEAQNIVLNEYEDLLEVNNG